MPWALPRLWHSPAMVTVSWRNSKASKLVPRQQNEASSDSSRDTTVAVIEAWQHWRHSGAKRQAAAATATWTSEGEEARSSSGDWIIVSSTIVRCIDWFQEPWRMTGETNDRRNKVKATINQRQQGGTWQHWQHCSTAHWLCFSTAQQAVTVFAMQARWLEFGGRGRGTVERCQHGQHHCAAEQAATVATARENKFKYNNHPIAHRVARGNPAATPSGNRLIFMSATINHQQDAALQANVNLSCRAIQWVVTGGTSGIKKSRSNLNLCQQVAMEPFGRKRTINGMVREAMPPGGCHNGLSTMWFQKAMISCWGHLVNY